MQKLELLIIYLLVVFKKGVYRGIFHLSHTRPEVRYCPPLNVAMTTLCLSAFLFVVTK